MWAQIGALVLRIGGASARVIRIPVLRSALAKAVLRAKSLLKIGSVTAKMPVLSSASGAAVKSTGWLGKISGGFKGIKGLFSQFAIFLGLDALVDHFTHTNDPVERAEFMQALSNVIPGQTWSSDPTALYVQLTDALDSGDPIVVRSIAQVFKNMGCGFGFTNSHNAVMDAKDTPLTSAGELVFEDLGDELGDFITVQSMVGDRDPESGSSAETFEDMTRRIKDVKVMSGKLGLSVEELRELQRVLFVTEAEDFNRATA